MQAFYDNDKAPANKRIKNMDQFNVRFSVTMEQMITAYTNGNRYAVPVVMMDGEKYYMMQNRDWHLGQPLVNWLSPNMLRSEEERLAHWGENIVLMNDKGADSSVPEDYDELKKMGDTDRIPSDTLVADRVSTLKSTFGRWLKARQALAAALPKEQGDSYDYLTADIHSRMVGKLAAIIPYENW